jgi:hypothetical protein
VPQGCPSRWSVLKRATDHSTKLGGRKLPRPAQERLIGAG